MISMNKLGNFLQTGQISELPLMWLHVVVASAIASHSMNQKLDVRLIIWQIIAISLIYLTTCLAQDLINSLRQRPQALDKGLARLVPASIFCLLCLSSASWIFWSTTTPAGSYSLILLVLCSLLQAGLQTGFLHNLLQSLAYACLYLTVFFSYQHQIGALFWLFSVLIMVVSLATWPGFVKLSWRNWLRFLAPLALLLLLS